MQLDFLSNLDYFLWPKKSGYTPINTLLYGLILIVAIYAIYKILKKLRVKIDARLAVAVAPFVVWGAALRVMQDAGIVAGYLFVTPGIYVFVFAVVLAVLLAAIFLERKKNIPYFKTLFLAGVLLVAFTLPNLNFVNYDGALLVLAFFLPWPIILFLLKKKWSAENKVVLAMHMFDASATAVSMQFFGYGEQHILPTYLINMLGPLSFIPIKLIAIVAVLLLIDKFSDDKEFNLYLKLCIGILGAATGARDFIGLLGLV